MYSKIKIQNPYCMECWNSDDRNPFIYGIDYDFTKNFFEQLDSFFCKVPILYIHHTGTVIRSDYTNYSAGNNDCYLSYSVIDCENTLYSENIDKSKNCLDCYTVQKMENCSYNIDCDTNYNSHYLFSSQKCIDSFFLYDCANCQKCCLSSNLRNKQYYFKNIKFTKDEYEKKLANLNLNTSSGLSDAEKYFNEFIQKKAIHRFAQVFNSQNATGDYIGNSKNIINSYSVQGSENIHYSYRVLSNSKDVYDNQGLASGELIYESVASSFGTFHDFFTYICVGSKECEYSFMCKNCSNCFACSGLKNSQYCIFNKQYKKEEYFTVVEKIKKNMDSIPYVNNSGIEYKYGEFFPYEMSPFGYNETNANDFFPLTKEEALFKGYPWKESEDKNYNITIESKDLPDDINDVDNSIIDEMISCPNKGDQRYLCTKVYRIILEELQFYKQKGLPLPRYCPNCRHYRRLKYRNPMKLYSRSCMNKECNNTFQTTYEPERPEIVYCEKCYQGEVY